MTLAVINLKIQLFILIINLCLLNGKSYKIRMKRSYADIEPYFNHSHSYSIFSSSEYQVDDDSSEQEYASNNNKYNSLLKLLKQKELEKIPLSTNSRSNKLFSDCNSLFSECLCSFNQDIERFFLYCNDPSVKKVPNFSQIFNSDTNLIFSKFDFRGSRIRRIKKDDFNNVKFDFYKPKSSSLNMAKLNHSTYESLLDELKKTVLPIYHLDFDNVYDIEDSAFEDFINKSLNLSLHLQENNHFDHNELLLKIRFSNTNFQLSPKRKPFRGLKALQLNLDNLTNQFLSNSLFDFSVISELNIENSDNFIGFIDQGPSLPNGKLLKKFSVIRSYKIDTLCSHSLPAFVDVELFSEISIRKCYNIKNITAYTFFKYRHLKSLILSSNCFDKIDKDSFRFLTQLEILDLSSNPLVYLEDGIFQDLSSLKKLILESTSIKGINEFTLKGLNSLVDLRISKSIELSFIHENAFRDAKKSLREIHLKDTSIRILNTIPNSWLTYLNLELLNLDSNTINEEFSMDSNLQKEIFCKIKKFLPRDTLISLQRNQSCNCLIYFLYMGKNFSSAFSKWEYKTPFCYRNQIKYFENGTKIFHSINEKEDLCELNNLEYFCNPTTTSTTTKTTTTTTTTRPTRKMTRPIYRNPMTTLPPKKTRYPKINFEKFIKVFLVILVITAISIFFTVIYLRYTKKLDRKKKLQKLNRLRANSNSSCNQTSSTCNLPRISSKSKINKIILPPNVIPPFTKNPPANSPLKMIKPKTLSQLMEYKSVRQNETKAMLNNETNQGKTASFSIGNGYD
ncbi:unnamed protein product [Brachionus calyciflorus]|uniref:Uncharacterized protein n=1 Tax=Brachionus calyciflorus TaxID=104777 RepID=A0A813YG71_9BILA|nr:unnamed protein product [Brachionus calyciflorus]